MQIYAARNNQRRYCFFYLIPVLICHCFIASKPQSFHVDDRHGKSQYTRQNDLPTYFCQLNFWQDWKIGQGRQVSMWVIILLPSTSRNSWAMYPLLLISLETSPGLPAYSVGHEKLIWTPLWDCRTIGVMMIKDEPAKHGRKSESWKLYECLSVAM